MLFDFGGIVLRIRLCVVRIQGRFGGRLDRGLGCSFLLILLVLDLKSKRRRTVKQLPGRPLTDQASAVSSQEMFQAKLQP